MTAFDPFDPIERRVIGALAQIAPPTRPDYLDEVLRATERMPQRPRWLARLRGTNATWPARPLAAVTPIILMAILVLAVIALAVLLGSGAIHRDPPPFGPAANGAIAYGSGGDLYIRDSLTSSPRPLVTSPGEQSGVGFSPNGRLVIYDDIRSDGDHITVANSDGSNPIDILGQPLLNGWVRFAPDSRVVAITGDVPTGRRLWLAHVNGAAPDVVDLGGLQPRGIAFRPGANQLAVQASNAAGVTDLYLVTLSDRPVVAGLQLRDYGVFAPDYQMSGVVFSPDGSWIAFNSPRADDPVGGPRYHVALVRPDGTDVHDLPSSGGVDFNQAWPSWSPDGRWIEVESWYDEVGGTGAHQISVAPGDGRGPSRPIGPAFDAQSLTASWSPDGQRIVLGVEDLGEAYLIDPVSGQSDRLPWSTELPDWQRIAP